MEKSEHWLQDNLPEGVRRTGQILLPSKSGDENFILNRVDDNGRIAYYYEVYSGKSKKFDRLIRKSSHRVDTLYELYDEIGKDGFDGERF